LRFPLTGDSLVGYPVAGETRIPDEYRKSRPRTPVAADRAE
jgi:hypothetical protein